MWKKIFKSNYDSQRFVVTVCATVAAPALLWIQSQIPLVTEKLRTDPTPYSASFFRMVTLGYWPAAVDWMWIRALQLIGAKSFSIDQRPQAFQVYELATDLDPEFYDFYEQAGVVFSFFFKSPDDSIHFLEKGIRNLSPRWTHPYTLHILLAYIFAFEKNDWVKAKEHFLKASMIPGAPLYLSEMKVWLEKEGSERELAKRVLIMLIRQTENEEIKHYYLEKLKTL